MKTFHRAWNVLCVALFLQSFAAVAETPPPYLDYQGKVSVAGAPFHGTGSFKFALVNSEGSTTLWSHDGTSAAGNEPSGEPVPVPVNQGSFQVRLGDPLVPGMTQILPANLFRDHSDIHLRVWFQDGAHGFQRLVPDARLISVPYAQHAASAESVSPGAIQSVSLANQSVTSDKLSPGAVQTSALQNGAVIPSKLDLAQFSSVFWRVGGNPTIDPATQFLGTTTAGQPLHLKAGNQTALRLIPGANDTPNLIGGHADNSALPDLEGVFIGGGGSADHPNLSESSYSVIAGGHGNRTAGVYSTISGGVLNKALAFMTTVAGGNNNEASGLATTISGGESNRASGNYATVPGGAFNAASGQFSLASGFRARAKHGGAFVWADSQNSDFGSSAPNQFLIRAAGGVGINATNPAPGAVLINNPVALLAPHTLELGSGVEGKHADAGKIGYQTLSADALDLVGAGLNLATRKIKLWAEGGTETTGPLGIGRTAASHALEVEGSAGKSDGSATWSVVSDRRAKTQIAPIHNALDQLDRVAPVQFRYSDSHRQLHPGVPASDQFGVIAQDFAQVFPSFVTASPDGFLQVNPSPLLFLNTAAIRELHHSSQNSAQEIAQLKRRNQELEQRLERLEAALSRLVR